LNAERSDSPSVNLNQTHMAMTMKYWKLKSVTSHRTDVENCGSSNSRIQSIMLNCLSHSAAIDINNSQSIVIEGRWDVHFGSVFADKDLSTVRINWILLRMYKKSSLESAVEVTSTAQDMEAFKVL